MKVLLTVLVCLVALSSARNTKNLMDSVTSMLQTDQAGEGGAAGAFETVLDYIETLKEQGIQDLADARQKRIDDAETCRANQEFMQSVIEDKQQNLDNVSAHLTWLNGEFEDSESRVAFVEARIVAIRRKYDDLKEQSCASSFLFVQDLKEHKDAMDLLSILEEEINAYFSRKEAASLVQVNKVQSLADKLSSFSRLFNQKGQTVLAQVPQTWEQLTDQTVERTDEQIGDDHVDNTQAALEANDVPQVENLGSFKGDLHEQMLGLIQSLREHLDSSKEELTNNNIQAATDFADFLRDMEDEIKDLREESRRKQIYLKKLAIDIKTAEDAKDNAQKELDTAIATLEAEIKRCTKLDAANAKRIEELEEELDIITQVEDLFHERIASIKGYVKERAEEHQATGDITTNAMKERVVNKNDKLEAVDYAPY